MRGVYTLPAGVPFLPSLAKGLSDALGSRLSEALILLPTRRAVRGLGDAFVDLRKSESIGATLLPRMRPLADVNPDEPPFEPGDLGLDIQPSIPTLQRRFELARLVQAYHRKTSDLPLSHAGALALVDPLLQILDDGDMEEVGRAGFEYLKEIEDFAAQHFQNASVFYKILQEYWPARMDELGFMAPKARQVALLNKLTNLWTETPPNYPVIIAGSTGTLKATARLMKCVTQLEDGLIVLPGLDKNLRESAWKKVCVEHPQGAMKTLIETLGVTRADVPTWPVAATLDRADLRARRRLISESLVPVSETDDWPNRIKTLRNDEKAGDPFVEGLKGLSLITAATADEEAFSIALIMRETLDISGQTCALVTPDPALARRVRAALRRWSVEVDYSQGEPLEETQIGTFLTCILGVICNASSRVEQAALFKQSLTALGKSVGTTHKIWNRVERHLYRTERRTPTDIIIKTAENLDAALKKALTPLTELETIGTANVNVWANALAQVAEALAHTDDQSGASRLWREDAGEKAAMIIEDLLAHGEILGPVTAPEFKTLFSGLMRGQAVRPRFGMHPRLQILGPLEARMLTADTIILGGLNEGIWPGTTGQAPFLSRLMRGKIGLSLPERRYGLAAHDFAELASNPRVILTRAERSDSGPMVASRWIWRLQTLVRGALGDTQSLNTETPYLEWARRLDFVRSDQVVSATRPEPRPPVNKRWPEPRGRQLSVTRIKVWIRDPYSLYAQVILGLRRLDDLSVVQSARNYGMALHKGLEIFAHRIQDGKTVPSADRLQGDFEAGLLEHGYTDYEISANRTRLQGLANALQAWREDRYKTGYQIMAIEGSGTHRLDDVDFTLTATADLIEKSREGYCVIDYKTGAASTVKVVKAGFDPQLPLTAFLLSEGAFDSVPRGETESLVYVQIKGRDIHTMIKPITPPAPKAIPAMDYAAEAAELLRRLVREYDDPNTAYASQPRAQYTHDYSDYDHLARRDEWARLGHEVSTGGGS